MARRSIRSTRSRVRSTVSMARPSLKRVAKKTTRAISTSRARVATKTKAVSTAKARVATATKKGKTTMGRRITSFKKPASRLKTTAAKSTKLKQQFSRKAVPKIRMGKIKGNMPAIFSKVKLPSFKVPKLPRFAFPKLPKVKLPKMPDPIGYIRGLDLKSKIPKLGFPKIKLPDVGGFLKTKVGDVVGSVTGLVEKTMGAAEDWKAKRDRKWLIIKVVVAIIIAFLGLLLWKKK